MFREDAASAWIADGWITREESGGAKLSYHWRPDGAGADIGVRKLFGAFDQNRWRDQKVTIGGGFERERYAAAFYATAGISGRRNVGTETSATVETTRSADAIGVYEQDVTTTTIKSTFERPYDWGVGGRIGHFYDAHLVRVDAGLDYEAGRGSSSQATLMLGIEKYFAGSPWSIAVQGEAYRKSGSEEPQRDDQRLWVMLRYEFGGPAWRPAKSYRDVRVETPAPLPPPAIAPVVAAPVAAVVPAPRIEKRIVKSTASASADAFFELDRAALKPEARAALDATIVELKRAPIEGNLRIVGHTCDLGGDAYNLALSQRRAAVVRDYLVQAGFAADRIVVEGMGERAPRFANDAAGRPRNRRVDIEFVTRVERAEEVAVPAAPVPATAAVPAPSSPPRRWPCRRRSSSGGARRSRPSPRGCVARCASRRATRRPSTCTARRRPRPRPRPVRAATSTSRRRRWPTLHRAARRARGPARGPRERQRSGWRHARRGLRDAARARHDQRHRRDAQLPAGAGLCRAGQLLVHDPRSGGTHVDRGGDRDRRRRAAGNQPPVAVNDFAQAGLQPAGDDRRAGERLRPGRRSR